jgi:hypothetical protein
MLLRPLVLVGALGTALLAQSPLTTVYASATGLASGATFYVDLVLAAPITFTGIDVNTSAPVNTVGSLDVRWTLGTYVGRATNAGAWTLAGSGPVVSAGTNQPSSCVLTPFTLPPGSYGLAITFNGIGPRFPIGNGTAVPGSGTNQTFANNEITMLCGACAQGAPGTVICCEPRVFSGALHYTVAAGGTLAQHAAYGNGCLQRVASVYETFATSASFDLANTAISFLATANGYLVLPGITAYVPPSTGAQVLPLLDDAETTVSLTTPFPHAGGATPSLVVCSNGFVSIATGNGTGFTPAPVPFLAAPQTAWWNQHDYDPAFATGGAGRVKFEEIGTTAYVTWDGVWDFGATSPARANTFQFQFDCATGSVHLVLLTMSTFGNGRFVGFSPGGPSADPGNIDLSAALPATIALANFDASPLALAAAARPVLGTTLVLTTSSETGTGVGVNFVGFAQIAAPGIDLAVLGAPGCAALLDVNQAVGNLIGNVAGTSLAVGVPLPNNLALNGLSLFSQSVWLDATANTFGAVTSNGVALVLGDL